MTLQSYAPDGATHSFTVPTGVTKVHVNLVGSPGGGGTGGQGGVVDGDLAVVAGDVIYTQFLGGGPGGGGSLAAGFDGGNAAVCYKNGTATANRVAIGAGGGGAGRGSGAGGGGSACASGNNGGAGAVGSGNSGTGGGGGTGSAGGAAGTGSTGGIAGSSMQGGQGGTYTSGTTGVGGGGGGGGFFGGGGGGSSSSGNSNGGGAGSCMTSGLSAVSSFVATAGVDSPGAYYTYTIPPNAPNITSPSSNSSFDQTLPLKLVWTFSTSESGATQASADVQYRVGAGAWTTLAGAVSGAGNNYTFAANTFTSLTGQTIEFQVRTTDNNSLTGPWSASLFLTPVPTPGAPTFDPMPSPPTSQWDANVTVDIPGTPLTGSYTVQIYDAANTLLGAMTTSGFVNATTASEIMHLTTPLTQGQQVRVKAFYTQGGTVKSGVADTGLFTVNFNAPKVPSIVLTPNPATATIAVAITNPTTPLPDTYPALSNNVFRQNLTTGEAEIKLATGVPINSTYTDRTPGSRDTYAYRVEAVSSAGGKTSSP